MSGTSTTEAAVAAMQQASGSMKTTCTATASTRDCARVAGASAVQSSARQYLHAANAPTITAGGPAAVAHDAEHRKRHDQVLGDVITRAANATAPTDGVQRVAELQVSTMQEGLHVRQKDVAVHIRDDAGRAYRAQAGSQGTTTARTIITRQAATWLRTAAGPQA